VVPAAGTHPSPGGPPGPGRTRAPPMLAVTAPPGKRPGGDTPGPISNCASSSGGISRPRPRPRPVPRAVGGVVGMGEGEAVATDTAAGAGDGRITAGCGGAARSGGRGTAGCGGRASSSSSSKLSPTNADMAGHRPRRPHSLASVSSLARMRHRGACDAPMLSARWSNVVEAGVRRGGEDACCVTGSAARSTSMPMPHRDVKTADPPRAAEDGATGCATSVVGIVAGAAADKGADTSTGAATGTKAGVGTIGLALAAGAASIARS
jgi:hypothetical protein